MNNVSQRAMDGYFKWEDGGPDAPGYRWWWYNNGGNPTPPAYGQGQRHYIFDTGFDALKAGPNTPGGEQDYQGFQQRVAQFYPAFAPFTEWNPGGGQMVRTGAGGGGGIGMGGSWLVQGDISELVQLVGKFVGGLSTPPAPPAVVAGDDARNFNNLGIYLDNLAQHARRDEIIRLAADGIGLALNQMGVMQLNLRDLSEIVAGGIASFSKLPDPPPKVDPVTGVTSDGKTLTTDQRFANLFTYLKNEADYWKRDEVIRSFGSATRFVLSKRAA